MGQKKIIISAVIVSYNSCDTLIKCIKSIESQVCNIIIVDNGSTNFTLSSYNNRIIHIKNKQNLGLGKALNIGIKKALTLQSQWVLLLDQDSIADKKMIEKMLNSYSNTRDKDRVLQVVSTVFDNNIDSFFPSYNYNRLSVTKIFNPRKDLLIDFHITAGSLIKSEAFHFIGFMDEDFFIDFIDYDYCFKLKRHGYKILLSHDALIYNSIGKLNKLFFISFIEHSPQRVYYQIKNRIIVMKRYKNLFPAFVSTQSISLILKFAKILALESHKLKKIVNFFKGLFHGLKTR